MPRFSSAAKAKMLAHHLNQVAGACPDDVRWEADGDWVRPTGRWAQAHHWLQFVPGGLSFQVPDAVAAAAQAFQQKLA